MPRVMPVVSAIAVLLFASAPAGGQSTTLPTGTRVDVYSSPGVGKGRGTITGAPDASGRYKVRYDGCTPAFDERVDESLVKKAAPLPRSKMSSLVARWAVFTPSYPARVRKEKGILRKYRTGALPPPLRIRSDGRFVWYYDYGHTPVRGRWSTDARIPGAPRPYQLDGIVIHDPHGHPWKVYTGPSQGDHRVHITAQRFCSGVTDIGTRV
jgi:hypothetical protein